MMLARLGGMQAAAEELLGWASLDVGYTPNGNLDTVACDAVLGLSTSECPANARCRSLVEAQRLATEVKTYLQVQGLP